MRFCNFPGMVVVCGITIRVCTYLICILVVVLMVTVVVGNRIFVMVFPEEVKTVRLLSSIPGVPDGDDSSSRCQISEKLPSSWNRPMHDSFI